MTSENQSPALTVLTVDDSKTNHKIVTRILSPEFLIESAFSGKECLELLDKSFKSQKMPHLILLDVTMPDMDGYETCQHIKSDHRFNNIPVLFLSGCCSIDEKLKGYEVGGDDYITKPFDEQELAAKIRKASQVAQQTTKLHQRAEVATQAVAKAVRVSSNISTCMRFMSKLALVKSIQELVDAFFAATQELGLSSSLYVPMKPHAQTFFDDHIEKELEIELFNKLDGQQTFVHLGRRLIVQCGNTRFLIKNMPILEERENETLKSYILTLLEGFHTRLRSLQVEEGVKRQREVLQITLSKAKELIDKMAVNSALVVSRSHDIFEQTLGRVEGTLADFGLNETQEQSILGQMQDLSGNMDQLHSSLLLEDKNVQHLTADLEKVVSAMSKTIDRDCGLSGT